MNLAPLVDERYWHNARQAIERELGTRCAVTLMLLSKTDVKTAKVGSDPLNEPSAADRPLYFARAAAGGLQIVVRGPPAKMFIPITLIPANYELARILMMG